MPASTKVRIALLASIILTVPLAHAQSVTVQPASPNSSATAQAIANVSITNASVSSIEGATYTLTFGLSNGGGVQTGVKYGIKLMSQTSSGLVVVDSKTVADSVVLGGGASVTKSIQYTLPSLPKGDYQLYIVSESDSGFPFGAYFVTTVNVSGDSMQGVSLEPETCYVTIGGEKNSPHHSLQSNTLISASEILSVICKARNTSSGSTTVTPVITTHTGSTFGAVVPNAQASIPSVTFTKGEEKTLTIMLPQLDTPQIYVATLVLADSAGNSSNAVTVTWTVNGPSAAIDQIAPDKDYYTSGDTAKVRLSWRSFGFDSATSSLLAKVSMTNDTGAICALEQTAALDPHGSSQELSLPVSATCTNATIHISLEDGTTHSVLDEKTVTVPTTSSRGLPWQTLGIIVIVIIMIGAAAVLLRRRDSAIPTDMSTPLVIFIIGISIFLPGGRAVHAATYPLGNFVTDWNSPNIDAWRYEVRINCTKKADTGPNGGFVCGGIGGQDDLYQNVSYNLNVPDATVSVTSGNNNVVTLQAYDLQSAWDDAGTALDVRWNICAIPSSETLYYTYGAVHDNNGYYYGGSGADSGAYSPDMPGYQYNAFSQGIACPGTPLYFYGKLVYTLPGTNFAQSTINVPAGGAPQNGTVSFTAPADGQFRIYVWPEVYRTGIIGNTDPFLSQIVLNNGGFFGAAQSIFVPFTLNLPDLTVKDQVSVSTPNVQARQTVTLSDTVTNSGNAGTGNSFYNMFWKADDASGTNRSPITGKSMVALGAGASDTSAINMQFPTKGVTYVQLCADHSPYSITGTIAESNENNNCSPWKQVVVGDVPVDGLCGSDNGQMLSAPPTSLCNSGAASSVSGSGPWTWSCNGINGGNSASCQADVAPTPTDAQCAADHYNCVQGTYAGDGKADSVNHRWTWTCSGVDGGNPAACTQSANGICGSSVNSCDFGTVTNRGETETQYTWNCQGQLGGVKAWCRSPKTGGLNLTVEVKYQGGVTGTVSSDDGQISNCTSTCSGYGYNTDDTINLSATPGPEAVVSWTGCSVNVLDPNSCIVNFAHNDVNVTATFSGGKADPHIIANPPKVRVTSTQKGSSTISWWAYNATSCHITLNDPHGPHWVDDNNVVDGNIGTQAIPHKKTDNQIVQQTTYILTCAPGDVAAEATVTIVPSFEEF